MGVGDKKWQLVPALRWWLVIAVIRRSGLLLYSGLA